MPEPTCPNEKCVCNRCKQRRWECDCCYCWPYDDDSPWGVGCDSVAQGEAIYRCFTGKFEEVSDA